MYTLDEIERRAYIDNDQATLRGIAAAENDAVDLFAAEHEAELEKMQEEIGRLEEEIEDLNVELEEARRDA